MDAFCQLLGEDRGNRRGHPLGRPHGAQRLAALIGLARTGELAEPLMALCECRSDLLADAPAATATSWDAACHAYADQLACGHGTGIGRLLGAVCAHVAHARAVPLAPSISEQLRVLGVRESVAQARRGARREIGRELCASALWGRLGRHGLCEDDLWEAVPGDAQLSALLWAQRVSADPVQGLRGALRAAGAPARVLDKVRADTAGALGIGALAGLGLVRLTGPRDARADRFGAAVLSALRAPDG